MTPLMVVLALFMGRTNLAAASGAPHRLPSFLQQNSQTKTPPHVADPASAVPAAVITGWALSSDPESSNVKTGSRVDLKADQSDIIFLFDSTPFTSSRYLPQVEFRYQLTGYDSEWTSTLSRMAHYRRLPPGKYEFQVQARKGGEDWNGEGWSSRVAKLPVRQDPHIYQNWYFYLSLLVPAAGLGFLLYRRRVQRMRGTIGIIVEERNRIARECHDTLMAGFAAISWQLEATSNLFHESGAESTPAAESCELARRMVAHCQAEARRIIWDLRDTDEVTNILSQALSRTLSANHAREDIRTTLDVEGEEVPLPPGCVHHLVCIGQEAVSNAMRHAQPSRIDINLKYDRDALSLTIRDDGRGFLSSDAASRLGHFGIPVMEERARKLGGTLRLQTSGATGTEVTVSISFNAMEQLLANKESHI